MYVIWECRQNKCWVYNWTSSCRVLFCWAAPVRERHSSMFWKCNLHCTSYLTRWAQFPVQNLEATPGSSGFILDTLIVDNKCKIWRSACFLISSWCSGSELVEGLFVLPAHSPLQLQQYQYYSAGLLSTYDPYYEQQRHLLGPKKKKFKEEKKIKGKVTNLMLLNGCCGLTSFLHCFLWLNINAPNLWVLQGNTRFWQRKMSSENIGLYPLAFRKLGWKKGVWLESSWLKIFFVNLIQWFGIHTLYHIMVHLLKSILKTW